MTHVASIKHKYLIIDENKRQAYKAFRDTLSSLPNPSGLHPPNARLPVGLFFMSAAAREMWQRLAEHDTDQDWFPNEMEKIRGGGSLYQLAQAAKVNYSVYRNWIRGNVERESALAEAERDCKANRVARVLQATFDTATSVSSEPVTHSERLRAAEILLKPSAAVSVPEGKEVSGISISFVDAVDGKPVK